MMSLSNMMVLLLSYEIIGKVAYLLTMCKKTVYENKDCRIYWKRGCFISAEIVFWAMEFISPTLSRRSFDLKQFILSSLLKCGSEFFVGSDYTQTQFSVFPASGPALILIAKKSSFCRSVRGKTTPISNPVHNVKSGRRLGVASILYWRKIRCDMDEKVEEWEYIFPLCVFIYFSGMSFPSFYLCSAYLVCELVSVCVYVIGIMFNKEARIDYDTGWCDHFWHSRTFLYLFQSCEFIYVKNVILQGICSFSSSLLLCVVAVALLSVSNVSFFSSNFCQREGWGENLCPVSK